MSEEKISAKRMARAGVHGYVKKTTPTSNLKAAIRIVLAGGFYFSSGTMPYVRKKPEDWNTEPESLINTLSTRQREVFKLIGQGRDTAAITTQLKISPNTIDTHRINIKNKLGLPNGKALNRLAYEVCARQYVEPIRDSA